MRRIDSVKAPWVILAIVVIVLIVLLSCGEGGTRTSGDTVVVNVDDQNAGYDFSADTGRQVNFRVIGIPPPTTNPYLKTIAMTVKAGLQRNYLLTRLRAGDSLTSASRLKWLALADSVVLTYLAEQDSLLAPPDTVTPPPVVAAVTVAPATFSVTVGGTGVQLTATAKDASGATILGHPVSWGSTSAAAVSPSGFVIATAAGTATVTATVDGVSGVSVGTVSGTSVVVVAELPRLTVSDVAPTCPNGNITVSSGGNLAGALTSAVRGQCIVLDSTAKFISPANGFVLGTKAGVAADGYVTLKSNGHCPARGVRVNPNVDSVRMATIENAPAVGGSGGAQPAIITALAADGWWLSCIRVAQNQTFTNSANNGNILLGDGSFAQNTIPEAAQNLGLDHVYVSVGPAVQTKRCVAYNAGSTVIVDSYLKGCAMLGQDGGNAIGGWNALGPLRVENNYLEAPGEVIIFGGSDPNIPNAVASDITIRRNYMYSRPEWQTVGPTKRTKKNVFELKNSQRVLVEGNILRNNWIDAQAGSIIVIGSVNQSGSNQIDTDGSHCVGRTPSIGCTYSNPLVGCTWCIVADVTFRNNWIDSTAHGLNLFQGYATTASTHTRRIVISNNLWTNHGVPLFSNNISTKVFQVNGPVADIVMDHNTWYHTNNSGLVFGDGSVVPKDRFTFTNNIGGGGTYNVFSSFGQGTTAFSQFAPTGGATGNVFIGATPGYPSGTNLVAANLAAALTTITPKWRPTATYAGKGADIAAIEAACGCVIP